MVETRSKGNNRRTFIVDATRWFWNVLGEGSRTDEEGARQSHTLTLVLLRFDRREEVVLTVSTTVD